jgi:tetratricopeptide (TPR) repeat protein
MNKKLSRIRTHIKKHGAAFAAISAIVIVMSVLLIVVTVRDRLVAPLMRTLPSDTLVRALYFDKQSDPGLYFSLGNYYFGEGQVYDLEKSKKYFEKTLALDAQYPWANYQLSRVYFIEGDQPNALMYINKELTYHPENKRSHYIRGLVYGYTGELGAAARDFISFLEWKPTSWAGHNDLAWIYFQQGDFDSALETAVQGLKHAPGNPWLLNSVGVSLKNLGDEESALVAFEKAKLTMESVTPERWGLAYPGNDPQFYTRGQNNMRSTIQNNIHLITNK